ncbi:two-component regulator propeller domain-containing protein [Bacteroides congonensis]
MKRHNLIFIFLFAIIHIIAQPHCQVKHFTVNDGLSQGVIVNMFQDKKGYLWFGTWNGLNRFDGYNFKHYKAFPGDKCTLTTNRLVHICKNSFGDIWCKTYDNKIYLFDTQSEKFIDIFLSYDPSIQAINAVERIYPLEKGVTWIVCQNGYAFRIDEKTCKEGQGIDLYSPFNKTLKGEKILDIYQDSEGDEWILTNKGVNIIGKKQIDSDFPFKGVKELNGDTYLISTSEKIATYNPQNKQIKFMEIPYQIDQIYSMISITPANDSICIGTSNGLLLFLPKKKSFQLFDVRTPSQASTNVLEIYQDHTGDIWIFTDQSGITRMNLQTGDKRHYQSPVQSMYQYELKSHRFIHENKEGTLWVIPVNGEFCYYDRQNDQLKLLITDPENPKSLYVPYVRNFYEDQQGNFWFTNGRGVDKLSFFPQNYQLHPIDKGMETRAFLVDKQQRLWTASKKGFIRIYDALNGKLLGYLSSQGSINQYASPFIGNIYCFLEDTNGDIWMGSKTEGLFQLRKKDNHSYSIQQYCHQPEEPYSLSNNSVYSIFQDNQGRIWIGCYGGGLNLLSKTDNGKIHFIHSGNRLKNYPISTSRIRHISGNSNGAILVGSTNGLVSFSNKFDQPEEIKFYQNVRIPDVASSLSSNDVMHIYTNSRKNTYVLTFTGGINQIISENILTENIKFKTYTTLNGLSSDLVLSMIEDSRKNLWIISENSLTTFDPEHHIFNNFGSKFLQQDFFFSEAIPVLNAQKHLLIGTDKGIMEITPGQMIKSSYTPPIILNGLKIQGVQKHIPVDDIEELILQSYERNVTFQFVAIDYSNPEEINYAYRLEGLEEEWNEADKNRSATYINLPPGEYKLQIRSTNSDGVWTDNTRTLPVKVLPTIWETYWAWLIYVFLFLILTSTIVYILFYIYRLRHQVDMEQQLSNIKLRFFTDISHELRTPLTLISSPVSEVLEHEHLSPTGREHLALVHKNTERMLRLVNQILDFRKIQNNKMKLLVEKTDIIALINKTMESFHLIANEKRIDFYLQTDNNTLFTWIDRDKFEKILFNLLSNAFKFTPAGKSIVIKISVQSESFTVAVKDEGIGIDPKKQPKLFQRFETLAQHNILQPSSGIGLSLVRELIELHHGNIEVKSETNRGSEFIVTLPLGQQIYQEDEHVEFILSDETTDSQPNATDSQEVVTSTTNELISNISSSNEDTFSILIVEDNKELRIFLRNILLDDYHVLEANNGEEGFESAQQNLPDLIITDVMMPIMDGLDMVKAIKNNNDICHIPVIMLSAKSSLDDRIAGLEQGIDDYITKPFSATYLKTRITSLLRQRKQLQELYLSRLAQSEEPIININSLSPSQPQFTPYDEQFMQQVMEYMEEQMGNSELTVDDFAEKLLLSRTIFYRKLKSIIGLAPVDFIRNMRIKRASQLIDNGNFNMSQIAYMIGFSDPKYFSKCFKKQMGMSPSEYKEREK